MPSRLSPCTMQQCSCQKLISSPVTKNQQSPDISYRKSDKTFLGLYLIQLIIDKKTSDGRDFLSPLPFPLKTKVSRAWPSVAKMLREVLILVLGLLAVNAMPWDPVDLPGYPLYGLKEAEIDPFIVGGSLATTGQFPYQAALRTPAGLFFCGGVIISNVSSKDSNYWLITLFFD